MSDIHCCFAKLFGKFPLYSQSFERFTKQLPSTPFCMVFCALQTLVSYTSLVTMADAAETVQDDIPKVYHHNRPHVTAHTPHNNIIGFHK